MKVERGKAYSACALSHGDDNFPLGMPCSQIAHGFRNFTQRICPLDNRPDLSALKHVIQNHEILSLELRHKEDHLLARSKRCQSQLDHMAEWADPAVGFWSTDDHQISFRVQNAFALRPRPVPCNVEQ